MMKSNDIKKTALETGFEKVYILKPERAERPLVNRLNDRVTDDFREIMEDAKSVIVLLKAYSPYEKNEGAASVSAYYPVSNEAYHLAKAVADKITENGFKAVSNVQIAIKPFLLNASVGQTGRNSLISVDGLGTRFHAQIILTDALLETDDLPEKALVSDMCLSCGACVKACPSGAIGENGYVDAEKCLRGHDDGEVVPEELRKKYRNRLLGCDVCQEVCPRNADVKSVPTPAALSAALEISELLKGNVNALTPFLGRNYTRKSRIRLKAALVAANMGRTDLKPELIEMAEHGTEGEKEHAEWALRELEKR